MKVEFLGNPVSLVGSTLNVGDTFPNFKATDVNFNKITLKNIKGKTLFLTIPCILTDVCAIEVEKFSKYLKNKDITCYVISLDLPFIFTKLPKKFNDNIHFLSDVKFSNFGKKSGTFVKELGILTRAVFLINENNVIEYVDYLKEISDEPNYKEILKLL